MGRVPAEGEAGLPQAAQAMVRAYGRRRGLERCGRCAHHRSLQALSLQPRHGLGQREGAGCRHPAPSTSRAA
eukprot:15468205-Alexandrium_andersonii.AAC.1